jgi:hypothetical protein
MPRPLAEFDLPDGTTPFFVHSEAAGVLRVVTFA